MSARPAPEIQETGHGTGPLVHEVLEEVEVGVLLGLVAVLTVTAWVVLPRSSSPSTCRSVPWCSGSAWGMTAHTLGVRHVFAADHIAAIDNTTGTLMAQGRRPVSVGSGSPSGTPEMPRVGAENSDAVIHLAFTHDFSDHAGAGGAERA